MSAGQFHWSRNPIRLYRDTERGKVAGVCAGLANYFDIRVKFVRLAVILGMVFGFFVPILVTYILMALLLKPKPTQPLFASEQEEHFWRTVSVSPNLSVSELRKRFRGLDRRLSEIESRVTSDEFDLRRKFRDLNA
jgi:phage shock protein C